MLDFNTKNQIQQEINNVQMLLDSQTLDNYNPNLKANWTSLLISMKDLAIKSEKLLSKRINFTDNVKTDSIIKDVTDLISFFRNAACHPEADNLKSFELDGIYVNASFNYIQGKGSMANINGVDVVSSELEDDFGLNMGAYIIYLQNNIIKAFEEIKVNFQPYL